MYIYFWFLIAFLVVNGFLLLDEELLIIIASIVWLDAAGGFIRNALWSELEDRGDKIKDQFEWFLKSKITLSELVISRYKARLKGSKDLAFLYNLFATIALNKVIKSYFTLNKSFQVNSVASHLYITGFNLALNIYYSELNLSLDSERESQSHLYGIL